AHQLVVLGPSKYPTQKDLGLRVTDPIPCGFGWDGAVASQPCWGLTITKQRGISHHKLDFSSHRRCRGLAGGTLDEQVGHELITTSTWTRRVGRIHGVTISDPTSRCLV